MMFLSIDICIWMFLCPPNIGLIFLIFLDGFCVSLLVCWVKYLPSCQSYTGERERRERRERREEREREQRLRFGRHWVSGIFFEAYALIGRGRVIICTQNL